MQFAAFTRTPYEVFVMTPLFTLAQGTELVLASGSPRRNTFLGDWGVPYTVRPVAGEPDVLPGQDSREFALHCALFKMWAARKADNEVIVAADTIVTLDGRVMGKPRDRAEALDMLKSLSGRAHQVTTAVALAFPDNNTLTHCDVCNVHFASFEELVLKAYVATGECDDKAGAYAIQGKGAFLVDRIDGSWSTVVGLPVTWVVQTLLQKGILLPANG